MLIKKNIEVGIDIQNPINVFADPGNLLNILADKYEGICYRGCYIKRVERIIRQSECIISQDGDPEFGTISVCMEVTAVVYAEGEIINGCVVKNKQPGMILCSTDITSICLLLHKSLESLTPGQIISIRVAKVKYSQGSHKISISAIPYLFTNKSIVYRLEPAPIDKELLSDAISRLQFEQAEMEKLKNSKAWQIFSQMLYAYNEVQPAPPGAKIMDLTKLVDKQPTTTVYLSRDPRINLETPNVYAYVDTDLPAEYIPRYELNSGNVVLILIEDYCAHLRTIREMIEIYSTKEILESHRNLWQIFKKSKY